MYACLIEEPAYLHISYHCVCYLKYAELKSVFWAPSFCAENGILASKSLWIFLWEYKKQAGLC